MEIQNYKFLIVNLRNTKVLLDFHLSNLYEVETRVLNQVDTPLMVSPSSPPDDYREGKDKRSLLGVCF